MAFNPDQSKTAGRMPQQRPTTPAESWRKDAFLNFSMSDGKGNFPKLGSIGLKMSKVRERQLIEWLMADPSKTEDRCKLLVKRLVVEIRSAEPSEDSGFDLSDEPETPAGKSEDEAGLDGILTGTDGK